MSDAECGITSIRRSFYSLCAEKHVVGELKTHAVDSFVIASVERLLDTLCVFSCETLSKLVDNFFHHRERFAY